MKMDVGLVEERGFGHINISVVPVSSGFGEFSNPSYYNNSFRRDRGCCVRESVG